MSKDIALFNLCDHKISEEVLDINPTTLQSRLTYISNKNINLFNIFRKYWNTEIPSTQWTLDSTGQIITFLSGSVITDADLCPAPIYLCNYTALSGACPKCCSFDTMNDAMYGSDGKINYVENTDKLKQYIKKSFITNIKSNSFHPEYGTYLSYMIAQRLTPQAVLKINYTIDSIANTLKGYQEESFNLNDYEILYDIANINLEQTDSLTLGINITIYNRKYEQIVTTTEILL
jgi:hypothetical protein